jgi:hypothetical protein
MLRQSGLLNYNHIEVLSSIRKLMMPASDCIVHLQMTQQQNINVLAISASL